jgi:hypothetical protein
VVLAADRSHPLHDPIKSLADHALQGEFVSLDSREAATAKAFHEAVAAAGSS